jgi:hypothetical protein
MIIKRKDAIKFVAFLEMLSYSSEQHNYIITNILAESGDVNISEIQKSVIVRAYISNNLKWVLNKYLMFSIRSYTNVEVIVIGKEPKLYICNCCGFESLQKYGEYCICEVCYWEDDGSSKNEKYSSVNHMTLESAKKNFLHLGIIDEKYLKYAHKERTMKYKNIKM